MCIAALVSVKRIAEVAPKSLSGSRVIQKEKRLFGKGIMWPNRGNE